MNIFITKLLLKSLTLSTMSLAFTKNVLQALEKIPEMNKGMYTRFSIILYQLVKEYHPTVDVELIYTGEDVAVITINDFVINPYKGITLLETERIRSGKESLEEFIEAQPPTGPEVMKFLEEFMKLLKDLELSTPLAPEIFLKRQSKFYKKNLAIDITLEECKTPNPGVVYKKKPRFVMFRPTGKLDFVFETRYRLPNISGLDFTIKPVIVNDSLLVVVTQINEQTSFQEKTCGFVSIVNEEIFTKNSEDKHELPDVADLTLHFVKNQLDEKLKLFKPMANLEALSTLELYGDFAAAGLLSSGKGPSVALKIYSKNCAFLALDPKSLICTLQVLINDNTVNIATEEEESTFNFPLQKTQNF